MLPSHSSQNKLTRVLFLNVLFLLLLLSACSEEKYPEFAAKTSEKIVTTATLKSVPTKEMEGNKAPILSASKMLAAFHKDIEVCKSAVKLLKDDRSFVDIDYSTPQPDPLDVISLQPQYANTPTFQHILSNREYIVVGIANMEIGNPFAEAWTDNDEHIFCQLTPRRMDEIELLGESPEAWEVRKYFLDKTLNGLSPITSLMADAEIESEWLITETQEASQRYVHDQRPKFLAWVKKAIQVVEKERNEIKADDVFSIEWQRKTLDRRLAYLRDVFANDRPIQYPNPNPLVGSWKSQSDRIDFGVYKRGTYYRDNEVCFEFSYLVRDEELLRVGDSPDVCNLGLIARYHVSITNDTLILKNLNSKKDEMRWKKLHDQNSHNMAIEQ